MVSQNKLFIQININYHVVSQKKSLEKEYEGDQEPDEMEEEEKPKPKKQSDKPKPLDKKLCKINTKESIPIAEGQCSQLPKKLKVMLSQDKIFEYDPNLSVSNGFRKERCRTK